jgi:uncharacterized protein (TIGR02271 family)
MTSQQDVQQLVGRNAVDANGEKIGRVGQVYLDDQTGEPAWVTVNTGLFGTKQSFAPLYGHRLDGQDVVLTVSKDLVKDAPNIDDDGQIDESEQQALYDHYAQYVGSAGAGSAGYDVQTDGQVDDTTERTSQRSSADDAMTRSEERLNVGTERTEAGRVRLRKYVTTEQQQVTVPVQREEARLEREPITEANRDEALSGPEITEAEHEVVLTEERPVVTTEAVPVERVRLGTDTVSEQQTVSGEVRKEQIEVDDDDLGTTDRSR